jgi:serine phosphatase RsbU (regulator of sigma subunit)
VARLFLLPRRAWVVLVGGGVAEIALFYGVGLLGDTHRYLGIPGAAAALFAVMAAVVTGPWIGTGVALIGGAAFVVFVAGRGDLVDPIAIVVAIALWILASVIAGMAGKVVRQRAAAHESLLSKALADSEHAKGAIENILALGPIFQRFETREEMVEAICAAARETFAARSASLYRCDWGNVTLMHREPPDPRLRPGWTTDLLNLPGLQQAMMSGAPGFTGDLLLEDWPKDQLELGRSLGLRSLLRIPIHLTPTSAYLLVLGWDEARGPMDTVGLALAQRFADQAAVALEHSEADALHRRLEKSLLSHSHDPHPWLEVHIAYRSGESRMGVGGDFVDYMVLPDKRLCFVIGDVTGHGPDAAALGAALRAGWRALATAGIPLEETMESLNKVLLSERGGPETYCTLLTGVIDCRAGSLTLADAGHPPPILIGKGARLLPAKPVLPLGCEHDNGWHAEVFPLPDAWSLLLCTDGLYEGAARRHSGDGYPLDRLVERLDLAGPGPVRTHVVEEIMTESERAGDDPFPDDVAVLLVSKIA